MLRGRPDCQPRLHICSACRQCNCKPKQVLGVSCPHALLVHVCTGAAQQLRLLHSLPAAQPARGHQPGPIKRGLQQAPGAEPGSDELLQHAVVAGLDRQQPDCDGTRQAAGSWVQAWWPFRGRSSHCCADPVSQCLLLCRTSWACWAARTTSSQSWSRTCWPCTRQQRRSLAQHRGTSCRVLSFTAPRWSASASGSCSSRSS